MNINSTKFVSGAVAILTVLFITGFFLIRRGGPAVFSVSDDTSFEEVMTMDPVSSDTTEKTTDMLTDASLYVDPDPKPIPLSKIVTEVPSIPDADADSQKVPKQTSHSNLSIREQWVDFGFSVPESSRVIDTIILHSSYDALGDDPYSVSGVIKIWKSYGVAPHYLIDRDGGIRHLVRDENVAYHAGVSQVPDGRKNVNDFSIGIEIINTLDGKYTDKQYKSVKELVAYLKGKYAIKYVLGHNDIASERKTDPWNFDWTRIK